MEVVNTVGRRKAAVARVFVKPGKGEITINRKSLEVYFPLDILQFQVKQPLLATNTAENYDITINLDGGGSSTLWCGELPDKGIANTPSGSAERKVANSLCVYE